MFKEILPSLKDKIEETIIDRYERCKQNESETARSLSCARGTVRKYLKQYKSK